jgi:DNA-3-methyladenine glycosylase
MGIGCEILSFVVTRKSSPTVKKNFEAGILQSRRLPRAFYADEGTEALAKSLLGMRLVTASRGARTSGIIVEVEAYLGDNDPACHAARGITKRNAVMFQAPGHCYVYLIYGMYHCVNVVSDPEGVGSAVLIRAIEPLEGIEVMRRRRGRAVKLCDLARGPGRLCEALGISTGMSGEHFAESSRIWIEPHTSFDKSKIGVSGRIGISVGQNMPLRFFVKDSPWVSGKARAAEDPIKRYRPGR